MESLIQSDLQKLCHHSQIYFAVFCAEQVFHLVKQECQPACRHAIDIAKLFIEGKATKEECKTAANAAADTAYVATAAYATATYAAAYAAVDAAYAAAAANAAAAYATYAAATYAAAAAAATEDKQAIIAAQWVYYNELLAFETIVEDVLLA
jgi:hypothetical protein